MSLPTGLTHFERRTIYRCGCTIVADYPGKPPPRESTVQHLDTDCKPENCLQCTRGKPLNLLMCPNPRRDRRTLFDGAAPSP